MEINLGGFLFAATTLPLLTVNQHSCELHQEAKANFCKLLWGAHNFTGTVVSEEVSAIRKMWRRSRVLEKRHMSRKTMNGSFLCWYLPVEFRCFLQDHGPPNMHVCSSPGLDVDFLRLRETGPLRGTQNDSQIPNVYFVLSAVSSTSKSMRRPKEGTHN